MSLFLVIPVVTGSRVFLVQSNSDPTKRHIADLSKATCTCIAGQYNRGSDRVCFHLRVAAEFDKEQRELQEQMPVLTARLQAERSGKKHLPRVPELTDEEVREIFA